MASTTRSLQTRSLQTLRSAFVLAGLVFCSTGCDIDTAVAGGELTYKVSRGDLVVSFTERGSVMAAKSEQIFCMVEGRSTIVSIVPEGTFVKKGDVLVGASDTGELLHPSEFATDSGDAGGGVPPPAARLG